jgi:hypothetical protein
MPQNRDSAKEAVRTLRQKKKSPKLLPSCRRINSPDSAAGSPAFEAGRTDHAEELGSTATKLGRLAGRAFA